MPNAAKQNDSKFTRWSHHVVADFLGMIVVIDDRAQMSPKSESVGGRPLRAPGRRASVEDEARLVRKDEVHGLDAKEVIDRFAEKGIVCAVLCPSLQELDDYAKRLHRAVEKADVLIVDWVLFEYRQGEKTIEVIKSLFKKSIKSRSERSRLVLVYTGEPNLSDIANSIRTALGMPTEDSSSCTVQKDGLRVGVYAKKETGVLPDLQGRIVSIEDLPEIVVQEFAAMTQGLVSHVVLKSIAAIRSDTFRILQRFNSQVDAPYVTHHALKAPEAAAPHLVPLIASELESVLEDHEVEHWASMPKIKAWLDDKISKGLDLRIPPLTSMATRNALLSLIEKGMESENPDDNQKKVREFFHKKKREVRNGLTSLLAGSTLNNDSKDEYFAQLTSIRSHYVRPHPILALGAIVEERTRKSTQYLVCLQPRCDSVRINGLRSFPFLPLEKTEANKKFDFVVSLNGGTVVRLKLTDKPHAMKLIDFRADKKHQQIIAYRMKSGLYFKAASRNASFRWVADLKREHAQRIANNYAAKLCRVGLDESEWLRLWAEHGTW